MIKRIISLVLAFFLSPCAVYTENDDVALRALLIGIDTFFTQENTYPIAETNLTSLADVLSRDGRTYRKISAYYDEIGHETALKRAVDDAFAGADENDVSVFFITTHGTFAEEKAGLYLCDGSEENILSPQSLADMLRPIPGKKIIILDACNSGAFIGKGMDALTVRHPFTGPDFFVITSAGGCEASWQWQSGDDHVLSGGSYFADVLVKGLTLRHAADQNRDGVVSINEMFAFLTTNYAASTPQRYPMDAADFPLYCFRDPNDGHVTVSDITFDDTLLTGGISNLNFSFTVHQPVSLYYQLVYYQNGAWDFENAQLFQDLEGENALLSPGRKQRSLHLGTPSGSDSGYAMIQFFTMENNTPVFQGARLLCVQPERGEVQLHVETAASFRPWLGEEMSLLVSHNVPCSLSVSIRNASGKTVKRLSYAQPSRPQQLPVPSSPFYWDGTDNQGRPLPPGVYTAYVQVYIGDVRFTAESAPFTLEAEPEKEGSSCPSNSKNSF